MNIIELKDLKNLVNDAKLARIYTQFGALLQALRQKDLPLHIIQTINESIGQINDATLSETELRKLVKQKQTALLKQLEKELKIVSKNYYRTLYMVMGMSGIGVPIGVAFGLSVGNLAFLGVGFPIGIGIGLAIGTAMDKKALDEGRQLDVEIKY